MACNTTPSVCVHLFFKGQSNEELSTTSQSLESFSDDNALHFSAVFPFLYWSLGCNGGHYLEVGKSLSIQSSLSPN